MYKHVGKIINTDARCVVIWMQIPGRTDHALVINMDTLPPHFERPIRQILESQEGQSVVNFADVLGRRLMPDTGVRILDALHNARLLSPVHIDQIVMTPRPSMAFPLRQVISAMAEDAAKSLPPQTDFAAEKFNPHLHNQAIRSQEERVKLARNLLSEADDLSRAAAQKVEKAYTFAPELRPNHVAHVAPAPVRQPQRAPQAPVWTPPPPLPVYEERSVEVAGPLEDYVPPAPRQFVVETPTAKMSEIERYAAMMTGDWVEPAPEPVKAKPARAAKAPAKAPVKAPAAKKPKAAKKSG